MLCGDIMDLYAESMDLPECVLPPAGAISEAARESACSKLVQQAQMSKAMAKLLSGGLADLTVGSVQHTKLLAKFPQVPDDTVDEPDAMGFELVEIEVDLVTYVVRHLNKARAPDLTGRRVEHIQVSLAQGNEEAYAAACDIQLNTELTKFERQLLAPTAGTGLDKETDVADDPDVRPLGTPNKLRLVSTTYSNITHAAPTPHMSDTIKAALSRPFSDFFVKHRQFGIGVKGGLEAVVHGVQLLSELQPWKLWLKLDIRNAFNTAKRVKSLKVLEEEYPDTIRLLVNYYGNSWPTYFNRRKADELLTILVTTGSAQGDVYGGLMFAAAYAETL